jgi:hypothetical protein
MRTGRIIVREIQAKKRVLHHFKERFSFRLQCDTVTDECALVFQFSYDLLLPINMMPILRIKQQDLTEPLIEHDFVSISSRGH